MKIDPEYPQKISVNQLARSLGISRELADTVIAVLADANPDDFSDSTRRWLDQCWTRPRWSEIVMHVLNDILGGRGIVPIWPEDPDDNRLIATYVNAGDLDSPTVIFDRRSWVIRVTSISEYLGELQRDGVAYRWL